MQRNRHSCRRPFSRWVRQGLVQSPCNRNRSFSCRLKQSRHLLALHSATNRNLPLLPLLPPVCDVQAEQDIEDRKRELAEARVELAHKQEYEAVRKMVMQVCQLCGSQAVMRHLPCPCLHPACLSSASTVFTHSSVYPSFFMQVPSRATTLAEQQATQREIADLQQQSAALDALLDQRKQQFGGVLDSLAALQRCIEREEPEEGAAALGGEQGGAASAAAAAVLQQQQPMQVG